MRVSIIVPNYNGEALLKKNLPAVVEAVLFYCNKTKTEGEVIVADDASEDESVTFIKSQISLRPESSTVSSVEPLGLEELRPNRLRARANLKSQNIRLKLLENEKNLGFSSNVNNAVEHATGEIVVLLNTDIVPEQNFLKALLEHFSKKDVFAVGCMDKSIEEKETVLRGRGIGRWEKGLFLHSRGEIDKTNTLWVSGGSGAFRKSIWEKLRGFDTLYNPFYWEDIDLSYRAIKSGFQVLFEPKSIVMHEHEIGSIRSRYSSDEIKTISYRNQFVFIWKNITDLDLQIFHILWLPYYFFQALLTWNFVFLKGFLWALILLPHIIQSSLSAQKLFSRSDKEILQEYRA